MNFIVSIISGSIVFVLLSATLFMFATSEPTAMASFTIGGIVAFILALTIYTMRKTSSSIHEVFKSSVLGIKSNADYYAIAEEEINKEEVNKGLWSQALVEAKGIESLRKVEYMKLRAKQIRLELKKKS